MPELKPLLTEQMKTAMKAKDQPRLSAIRLILSEIKRIEVDERIEVDDERVLVILDKMLKQRKESIKQFQAADRQDLIDIEQYELELIQEFMPEPLSDAEIEQMIAAAMSDSGAESIRDMGKVMAILKPQVQGRADMGMISAKIKEQLSP